MHSIVARTEHFFSRALNCVEEWMAERLEAGVGFSAKCAGLFNSSVELINEITQKTKFTSTVRVFTHIGQGLDFVESVQHLFFWINPITLKKVDEKKLVRSMSKSLSERIVNVKERDEISQRLVRAVLTSGRNCHSKRAIRKLIAEKLIAEKFSTLQARQIVKEIKISKTKRPLLQKVGKAFNTVASLGLNIQTLNSWKVIDLNKVLTKVTTELPKLGFLSFFPFALVLSLISVVGNSIALSLIIQEIKDINKKLKETSSEHEVKHLKHERIRLVWDLVGTEAEILAATLPLILLPINPVAGLAVGVVAKVVAVSLYFFKPKEMVLPL